MSFAVLLASRSPRGERPRYAGNRKLQRGQHFPRLRSLLSRSIRIEGGELTYTLRLGAVCQPLQDHLAATLRKEA